MIPESKERRLNYQFQSLSEEQLTEQQLVSSLCDFYNQATVKENTERVYTQEEFAQGVLQDTLQAEGGKIVFAVNQDKEVCGFAAGYNTDFNRQTFQLERDVPEGTYFYMFGLGNSTNDPSVIFGLVSRLLNGVETDFCVGLVSHDAPIYKRSVYPRRSWTEIKSNLPIAQEKSYFYIRREEVIK